MKRSADHLAVIPHEVTATRGHSERSIEVTSSIRAGVDFMRRSMPYQTAMKTLMQHVFEDWAILWNGSPSRFFDEPNIRSETRQFLTHAYEHIKAFGAVVIWVYRDPSQWIHEVTEAFVRGDTRAGSTNHQQYATLPFGVVDPSLGTYHVQRRKRAPSLELVFRVDPGEELTASQYDFPALAHDVQLRDVNSLSDKLHSPLWYFKQREAEIARLRADRDIASHLLARPPVMVTARPENPEDPANMDVASVFQDDALSEVGGHSDQLHRVTRKELLERLGQVQRGVQIHPMAIDALTALPDDMMDVAPTSRMIWVDNEHEVNVTRQPAFQVDLSEREVGLERDICRHIGLPWIFYSGSVGTQRKGDSGRTGYTEQHDRIWRQELKATVQGAREVMKELLAWSYKLAFAEYDASLREERDAEIIALEAHIEALCKTPRKGKRLRKEERQEQARQLWDALSELKQREPEASEPIEGGRIIFYTSHALEIDEIDHLKGYANEGYLNGESVAWMLNSYLTSRIGELPSGVRAHKPPVEPYEQQQQQIMATSGAPKGEGGGGEKEKEKGTEEKKKKKPEDNTSTKKKKKADGK